MTGAQNVLETQNHLRTYHRFLLWAVTRVTDPDIPEEIFSALTFSHALETQEMSSSFTEAHLRTVSSVRLM